MADDELDDAKEYRWETGYEKTWEEIREDKEGKKLVSVF
jgi:transcription initiation factor TFIIH subunit 2